MSQSVYEVGRRVYKGSTTENTNAVTAIDIDTAKSIVLPAVPTGNGGGPLNGPLECLVTIEGANNSRFTTNGVTPTGSVGQLIVPSNGIATLVLRGQDVIASFKIIGGAAGNAMTYQFYCSDTR